MADTPEEEYEVLHQYREEFDKIEPNDEEVKLAPLEEIYASPGEVITESLG